MSRLFSYQTAALFILISAALHLFAPVIGGFTELTQMLLGAGILYCFLAWGMRKKLRWLAYFAFIILLFGMLLALGFSFGGSDLPSWLFGGIAIADLIAAAALFGVLWRSKTTTHGSSAA